jgi:hypothetical protein
VSYLVVCGVGRLLKGQESHGVQEHQLSGRAAAKGQGQESGGRGQRRPTAEVGDPAE